RRWGQLRGGSPDAIRTVEVRSPSAGDEEQWVFLTSMAVVLVVIYVVAFERGGPLSTATAARPAPVLPFQVLFRDLPGAEQRIFREMQEGALEALRIRGTTAEWPEVDALAAQGIAPFTADVPDRSQPRW